jgi:hypothetical protein
VELNHEETGTNPLHGKFRSKPDGRRLLRHDAGDRFEIESAGTRPGHVRPEAIAVMKELGIDISGHRSKNVQEFENQSFNYVLTVCDNAKESSGVSGTLKSLPQRLCRPGNFSRHGRGTLIPFPAGAG